MAKSWMDKAGEPDVLKLFAKSIVLGLAIALAFSVRADSPGTADQQMTAVAILFSEWEPDIDPYMTRTLVTPAMMRIDDNEDSGNFVLFDRKKRVIYSVTHAERRILEIRERPITATSPLPLTLEDRALDETGIPAIGGQPVTHYRFQTNGQTCMDVFAVAKILDTALAARREFQEVLATEQAASMGGTPPDMIDVCDLSSNIFHPVQHLRYGFPVHQWTNAGYHRQMVSYDEDYKVSADLFTLPAGYTTYSPGMMRGEPAP